MYGGFPEDIWYPRKNLFINCQVGSRVYNPEILRRVMFHIRELIAIHSVDKLIDFAFHKRPVLIPRPWKAANESMRRSTAIVLACLVEPSSLKRPRNSRFSF